MRILYAAAVRWSFIAVAVVAIGCSRRTAQPQVKPEPVTPALKTARVVASGQKSPWGVFVDGTHLYWANKGPKRTREGSIVRATKNGGTAENVVTGVASPYGIAVTDTGVFWTEAVGEGEGIGFRLGEVDSGVLDVPMHAKAPGNHEPWALVVRDGVAYWNDLLARDIESAPIGASGINVSTIHVLARTIGRPVGLAVDATHAYWTDSDIGAVVKVPISGGDVFTVYRGGDKTTGLAIDNDNVYWTEWGSGRIAKASKNGGTVTTLASDQKGARSIAVDDARVYFTHPASGSIRSVPKNGGTVFTHATGQKHPYSLTLDATTVYWANVDGDTVMAIEK